MSTIFALSSGSPPAGISIIRVSGPEAGNALAALSGKLPEPRRATATALRNSEGVLLDRALVLWMPGPNTVTGEDIAELHVHGGRAIVAAVEGALGQLAGLRRAEAGEFTRRAFTNGRIDLAEAEGFADLLAAETELQRQSALALSEGHLSKQVDEWLARLLHLAAQVEAVLDFEDEDDVSGLPSGFGQDVTTLSAEIRSWADGPRAERLKEGFRVVLAGPPNSGKSTLFNAIVEDEAAIISPIAGTTRDVIERSIALGGVAFSFVDTAGLRSDSQDSIERIGIERAGNALRSADTILWLGPEGEGPAGSWEIEAMADRDDRFFKSDARATLSATTGAGVDALKADLIELARDAMPKPGQVALNLRQRELLAAGAEALAGCELDLDPLLIAERLRTARVAFDTLTGRASTEDMLDSLFGRFCIGK